MSPPNGNVLNAGGPSHRRHHQECRFHVLEDLITDVYLNAPSDYQPVLELLYYVCNPRVSWRNRKRSQETTRDFSTRLLGDEGRLAAYEGEFEESCVGPAIGEATAEITEDASLFDAHRDECVRLYALVRENRPETVVETGVYNGVSTLSILAALEANGSGRLYSVDYADSLRGPDAVAPATEQRFSRGRPSCAEAGSHLVPAGKEPGWIVPEHLRRRWEYVPGKPQFELPPLLSRLGEIDLFHHDSSHTVSSMLFEFELAWQYLSPGGVAVSNHVGWNDAFETFVADRAPEYDLVTWHYNPHLDYDCPGSSGYVVKPGEDAVASRPPER